MTLSGILILLSEDLQIDDITFRQLEVESNNFSIDLASQRGLCQSGTDTSGNLGDGHRVFVFFESSVRKSNFEHVPHTSDAMPPIQKATSGFGCLWKILFRGGHVLLEPSRIRNPIDQVAERKTPTRPELTGC